MHLTRLFTCSKISPREARKVIHNCGRKLQGLWINIWLSSNIWNWSQIRLHQFYLTRSSRAECWSRQSVTLPAKTFETRSPLLTLSLARPRYSAETILKNFELIVYAKSSDILAYEVNGIKKIILSPPHAFIENDVERSTQVRLCIYSSRFHSMCRNMFPACRPNFAAAACTI